MGYHEYESELAQRMAHRPGLAAHVDFRTGDACELIDALRTFVARWTGLYASCLERFYPRPNTGAIIAAHDITRLGSEPVKADQRAVRAKPVFRAFSCR